MTDNQQGNQQPNQGYEAPAPGILFAFGAEVSSAQAQPIDGKGTSTTMIEVHPTQALGWKADGWTRFTLAADAARDLPRHRELVTAIMTPEAYSAAVACLSGSGTEGLVSKTGEALTAGAGKQPIASGAGNTS